MNHFLRLEKMYLNANINTKVFDSTTAKINKGEAIIGLDISDKYFHALGVCPGSISNQIKGTNGFGFDPIFIPESGDGRTFGEMSENEKASKSHRGESLRILYEELKHPSK